MSKAALGSANLGYADLRYADLGYAIYDNSYIESLGWQISNTGIVTKASLCQQPATNP